jgi:hypothetical protein
MLPPAPASVSPPEPASVLPPVPASLPPPASAPPSAPGVPPGSGRRDPAQAQRKSAIAACSKAKRQREALDSTAPIYGRRREQVKSGSHFRRATRDKAVGPGRRAWSRLHGVRQAGRGGRCISATTRGSPLQPAIRSPASSTSVATGGRGSASPSPREGRALSLSSISATIDCPDYQRIITDAAPALSGSSMMRLLLSLSKRVARRLPLSSTISPPFMPCTSSTSVFHHGR